MYYFKKIVWSIVFTFLWISSTFGQGNTGDDPDFPDVPLDGGMGLLIGAGALYAAKKLNQWKKEKSMGEK